MYRTALFAIGLGIMTASSAHATELYPTTLKLDRDKPVTTLRIRNDKTTAVTYELTGYRWTQEQGKDVHTPDESLIATPPILTLAPGENAIVRVGVISNDAPDPREHAYRLLVNDISPREPGAGTALNVRVQILLPVFLAALDPKSSLTFTSHNNSDGQFCVTGSNAGTAHAKMVWLETNKAHGDKIPTHQYFLAGSSAELCVDGLPSPRSYQTLSAGLTSAYQPGVNAHEIQIPLQRVAARSGE